METTRRQQINTPVAPAERPWNPQEWRTVLTAFDRDHPKLPPGSDPDDVVDHACYRLGDALRTALPQLRDFDAGLLVDLLSDLIEAYVAGGRRRDIEELPF